MGYEVEATAHYRSGNDDLAVRHDVLKQRWRRANGRLAASLASYAAMRGHAVPGDPQWLAAQLRIAEARQRCREVADDIQLLDLSVEPG